MYKKHYEESNKGYILKVNVKYSNKLRNLLSALVFQSENIKTDKYKKLLCNFVIRKIMSYKVELGNKH